jgi:PleD family two-component response regulator
VPAFTSSFGVAHSSSGDTLEDVCRVADVALFRAKREGRNRVVVDAGPVLSERSDIEATGA